MREDPPAGSITHYVLDEAAAQRVERLRDSSEVAPESCEEVFVLRADRHRTWQPIVMNEDKSEGRRGICIEPRHHVPEKLTRASEESTHGLLNGGHQASGEGWIGQPCLLYTSPSPRD